MASGAGMAMAAAATEAVRLRPERVVIIRWLTSLMSRPGGACVQALRTCCTTVPSSSGRADFSGTRMSAGGVSTIASKLSTLRLRPTLIDEAPEADAKPTCFNASWPVASMVDLVGGAAIAVGGIEAAKHVEVHNSNDMTCVVETRNCPNRAVRGYIAANGSGYTRVGIEYVHIDVNQFLRDPGTGGVARGDDFPLRCAYPGAPREW